MPADTLINPPSTWRKIIDWITTPSKGRKLVIYALLGVAALGLVLFIAAWVSNWWTDYGIRKDKAKIANTVSEIANISNHIGNLEIQKAEKQVELKQDIEDLANKVAGREDAKTEANQALANFNAALKTNSNVNATAEDIQKALDKLDQQ